VSRDLIDQLAEYGDQVRTAQRPIELTDVVRDNPGPLEVTMTDAADRPTSQKNWWLIGSAAAATLAIVVAGAVVLTGGDDGPDDELVTGDSSVEVTAPETLPPVESTVDAPPPDSVGDDQPVIPADALEEPTGDVIGPTGTTPLPDFENAVDGDDGAPRRPLGAVEELPESARLDFLADVCAAFLDGRCFRDAVFEDATGREVGLIAAGEPFHIRHGFVNEGGQPLSDDFDLAVYVFPMDLEDFSDERSPIGPTQRFTTDYVVRGETDA
jgi:hypothetical protein